MRTTKTGAVKYISPFALALMSSAFIPGFAHAQTDDAQADQRRQLDTITVTAERREQNLQDVPVAATVLSGEELAKRSVTDVNALQQVAPSVAINTYNRSTFINIRGVGIAQSAPTSNPGVAYYVDGVLIPHEQFIRQSFFDIESIEVLRGPQGTLTGQNSTGGAVYTRTPEPEFNEVFGKVDLTVAEYNKIRAIGAVNYGFTDNVALRLAGISESQDSFSENIGGSSNPGEFNMAGLRANLAYRTDDERFRFNIRGELFDYESDNNAVKNRNDTVTSDPFVIQEDAKSFLDQNGYRLSAEGRYEINSDMEFRALVSVQDGYTFDQTDGDRTATAEAVPADLPANGANRAIYPGRVSQARTDFETRIAEINLLSIDEGPLQWVVGAFYMNEDVPLTLFRDNYSTDDLNGSNSDIITEATNESASVFGQVNYTLNDRIEFLAGARYSEDSQEYVRFVLPGPPAPPFTSKQESEEITGKVGINYFIESGMLYATISKGYKAGGVNLAPPAGNFGPESNLVYETGFKTELLDRTLRINGDIFYSDYTDIQLASLAGGLPVTQNAASGEAYGAELEVLGQFGDLGVSFGIGYLDATFAEDVCLNDTNAPGSDVGCPVGNKLVPGGRVLPFSPEITANAGIEYFIDLGDGRSITPRLQWSHLSEQYATPFPSNDTFVPARDVIDARLSYVHNDDVTFEVFANNLLDETYIAAQIQSSSSATGGAIYGAPRQIGVRAVVNFD